MGNLDLLFTTDPTQVKLSEVNQHEYNNAKKEILKKKSVTIREGGGQETTLTAERVREVYQIVWTPTDA